MGEHRQLVDKRMTAQMNRHALIPLALNLGARYLVDPYMGAYNEEDNSLYWGLGHKKHGDSRHRTRGGYIGIHYRDGDRHEGPTHQIVTNRRLAWSRKHDNRLAQNDETYGTKEMSYDETYNEIRTFSSLDLIPEVFRHCPRRGSRDRRLGQFEHGSPRAHRGRNQAVQQDQKGAGD